MTTEYQRKIMELAGIQFENIEDDDVLTWDYFDQGFGVKGFYYLYRPDASLKDIQSGKPIDVSLRKYSRPMDKKSPEMIAHEEAKAAAKADKIVKIKPKNIASTIPTNSIVVESKNIQPKIKGKRNLSDEERARRAARMKLVAEAMWAKRRQNKQ